MTLLEMASRGRDAQMDVPVVDRAVKVSPLLKAADLEVLRQQVSRQLYRENTA